MTTDGIRKAALSMATDMIDDTVKRINVQYPNVSVIVLLGVEGFNGTSELAVCGNAALPTGDGAVIEWTARGAIDLAKYMIEMIEDQL